MTISSYMRRLLTRHRPTPAPPLPIQYNGFNAAFAANFLAFPDAGTRINETKATNPNYILRFPGGTVGNYYHTSGNGYGVVASETTGAPVSITAQVDIDATVSGNYLDDMVACALAAGAAVTWVANMYTGTTAESITAINAFLAAGVPVVAIELGNEWYLNRYIGKYPTHTEYIADALVFRDAMKAQFPSIPCGIVVAPSAGMKDPDSAGSSQPRLDDANAAIRLLTWPDAFVLHAYAAIDSAKTPYDSPSADAVCAAHRSALVAHIASLPGKPVWLTEWNTIPTSAGDTDTQANHYRAMRAYIKAEPRITIQTLHNLMGAGTNNNAIKGVAAGCTLNRLGRMAAGTES